MKFKTVKLKNVNPAYLWMTMSENFIEQQPDRFVHIEGRKHKKGALYFCDRYLEAKVLMSLKSGSGLYSDEYNTDDGWVVATSEKVPAPYRTKKKK